MDVLNPTDTSNKNGESKACSEVSPQHRRSKSASDRNLKDARHGVPDYVEKISNVTQDLQHIMIHGVQTPIHRPPSDGTNITSTNHRASLESDETIDKGPQLSAPKEYLQGTPKFTWSSTWHLKHVLGATWRKIKQLQMRLHEEKSMRITLERAMGRASSTLSPGHRHFAAQTRELIAEIESLEEEVANREQHVLSLYRSIFEQCVSGAPSEQSSGMTSPAHAKNTGRKHPRIISSAFCSSKKFPLQPFQVLASIKDSGKKNVLLQSKTRHASLLSGKTSIHIESNIAEPMKVHEKKPVGKSSLARTLKDHLYQCPSKLSEELVGCMAAIYCWIRSTASTKPEKSRSPLLSRSSTSVILPRRSIGDDQDWSCKSMVEISWLSVDKNQFSRASYAINNYRLMVEQLERVNPSQMQSDAKMAFWINVYNSLVMHAYLAYGIPHGSLRRMALFHKAAYNIGGHVISANAIEHTILCCRTPRTGRWFDAILSTAMRKKSGEERQLIGSGFGLLNSQTLICFALCSGAYSDPAVYTSKNVKEELERAKKEFLQANVVVKKSRKVFLPKILERYAKEAAISTDDLLIWVSENVDKKLQDVIQKCIDCKPKRKTSQIIEWLPYNTRFRYILVRELTEKPWWV